MIIAMTSYRSQQHHIPTTQQHNSPTTQQHNIPTWFTLSRRWVDDVRIGLGDCAVDDNGEAIAPGKMSIAALRVEAEVRGLTGTEDMKKTELAAAIKVRAAGQGMVAMQSSLYKRSEQGLLP